jgi:uncharacterized protein involved in response to NO
MSGLARVPLLSFGFRPFFLGGSSWAALAMPLWLALFTGPQSFVVSYGAIAWHAHEFLFGYVAAIAAGFLLTAIPNWTGRLPVQGGALLGLFALWAAGRAAMLTIDWIGFIPAVTIDSLFLPLLAAAVLREIVAGRNWRNVKVAALVTILAAADILFHVEVLAFGAAAYALRAAIAVMIGLIMLIGGRITPSFTRNWLAKRGSDRLPVPFGRYDMVAVLGAVAALVLWVAFPEQWVTALALFAAGILHAVRLSRWAGLSSWREPLVLVLHAGYAFVPLGLVLVASSILWPVAVPATAALHSWTAGAMGLMTLAVMTRASLGHTGRALTASLGTQTIYVAVAFAALSRIVAPLLDNLSQALLIFSAFAWTAAFAGFVVLYGPMILKPRIAAG